jgi:AraC family transcriptional regulator
MKKYLPILAVALLLLVGCAQNKKSTEQLKLTPRFETKPAMQLVGMEIKNTMDQKEIEGLWDNFIKRLNEVKNVVGEGSYGVTMFTDKSGEYTYIACVTVSSVENLPSGMVTNKIPASEYAVFEYKGDMTDLDKTYAAVFSNWLPKSGYNIASPNIIEYYGSKFVFGKKDSFMEIWVPVQKK